MRHTTLSTKGQVTIPAEIRAALDLQAGDRLRLEVTADGFTAVVERAPKVSEVRGRFRHAARPGITRAQERAAFETPWPENIRLEGADRCQCHPPVSAG